MLIQIENNLNKIISRIRLKNLVRRINATEYGSFPVSNKRLTKAERKEIMSIWGKLKPNINHLFTPPPLYNIGFQLFKSLEHFDSKWLTAPAMHPRIILALEDPIFQSGLVHKAGFSMYLSKIKQPRNVVKCIHGQYFNEEMQPITKTEAVGMIINSFPLIIKSTYGSCQGKSIQKLDDENGISQILDSYNGNLVCQELIKQSSEISKFHPQSVNSIRIITLFINGKITICVSILRIGQGNSIVDNAGGGGIMIGCDENGMLREYGYDHFGNKRYDNGDGLKFKSQKLSCINRILELSKKYHTYYFPTMGIVAWDWAVDEDNEPVFIEANLGDLHLFPGITTTQLAKGSPFFGDRTEEVIDFTNSHQDRIWKGLRI